MMRKRILAKRMTSFILCMALVLSGLTVPAKNVQAEGTSATETTSTTKTIEGLGTGVIADPTDPGEDKTKAWVGSYVYYGNYDADGDETAEPVKYRVLDASTTDYSADGTTQTMLLDCDSILYYQKFDNDATANEDGKKANDWSISDVKSSLNGDGFLNKEGVFTTAEKNAIAASTVDSHALNNDEETDVNVASRTQSAFGHYVALTGEQIFLLDAEDVSNGAYGYSMTDEATENRKKTGSSAAYWWLRSASNNIDIVAGYVYGDGYISDNFVTSSSPGVSPALNLNLSSVLFSSVISGTAGETGAEYKLTLLDSDMTIAANGEATRYGKTVTIPYSISGTNSANATQVSVLVLDKEYTAGNTNGATVLDYQKLNIDSFSASGTGTYTLPDSLYRKGCGTDYHMYILAEDVNGEKETDYAGTPVEIIPTWNAPTVKQMNFGTQGIIDPAVPNSASDAWKGCYVYYGNYDAGNDGTAEPVKYRVLDASTTDYSKVDENGNKAETMLLDCDSILYYTPFDGESPYSNVWTQTDEDGNITYTSPICASMNGTDFLNKEGVFTTAEKNAIAESNVATHTLTTDSATGVNVAGWMQSDFVNYVALTGEQIFLLDAEDVFNGAYGYSMADSDCENRTKKTGSSAAYWWLRSALDSSDYYAGYVIDDGDILDLSTVYFIRPGVSPAFNVNLSSVIFSSASGTNKSSALTSGSAEIGTEANTDWKLTLKDNEKSVALIEGRSVTKASDGTITVPYTYTDNEEATDKEKVNQISVMITDKAYGSENAQILYYGALQDIKNAEGTESTVAVSTTGTGIFALPSGLTGALGTDYHIYLLAEHVNNDDTTTSVDESLNTDYASEPKEITTILNEVDTVAVPNIDESAPVAERTLATEITISSKGVADTATLTWKKDGTEATGNAEWKTTYQAYVTLTAAAGCTFMDAKGSVASVTLNGNPVNTENVTWNEDGTLTVYCREYTTATRKTEGATAPEVPTQFANYYTAENVLSSTELGTTAKVTLQGSTRPNPEEMEVEWSVVNEAGESIEYDATPAATNIFKWTIIASEYANYDLNGVTMEGTVTIQNKRYVPGVTTLPTVADRVYHPTKSLTDTDLIGGEVKDKDGTALAGTWSWKDATVKPAVTDSEITEYEVIFTPKDSVYYEPITEKVTVKVSKATPYIKTVPTATVINYGESLSASAFSGAVVQYSKEDEATVEGTFTWKEAATKPTVADSGKTEYVVVFTPTDADNYNTVETKVILKVEKANNTPNKPENTEMTVPYTIKTAGEVTLPEGWVWQDADKTKALEVGKAVTATAIYNGADKGNYVTESVEVSITRVACEHKGETEVKDAKDATSSKNGYTGDTYCKDCGAKIAAGTETPAKDYVTATAADKKITSANTDKADVAGSTFAKLQLKATGKNKSVQLTWKKVKGADGYILYGAKCGTKLKKIKTFTKASNVKYTQKKLKKGTYYKYMVVAYKNVDGEKYIIASSKSAHAVTTGGKYANPSKVTVKASKIAVKKGKSKTIKASYKIAKGKRFKTHIAKFRYESSNTKIATVNKKGKVTGKKKGTCYIYVYAQNGVYKKVKVTVK